MQNIILKLSAIFLLIFITSCNSNQNALDNVTSSYFTLNNSRIHYKEFGQGQKTLIFIHGWGCDLNVWKYQFDYFKNKHHIVLIDLPGYGQSNKTEQEYTINLFAKSVSELINNLEITNPVLIAHSMGLPIAIEVTKQLNTENTRLVNIDGVYFDFPTDSLENIQYKEALNEFANLFNGENYKQNVEKFCSGFITEETPKEVSDYIISTMTKTPERIGYQSMKSLVDENNWDKKTINNQTIAIYAKIPELLPENESVLKKKFSNMSYIELDSVNHFLMMEKPKKVNEILEHFIEK